MNTQAQTQPNPVVKAGKISLMGIGQCALSGNALSGALILAGVAYSSWQAALWFLLGSFLTSAIAKMMKAPDEFIDIGMYGFGGGYVGVLVGTFFMMHVPAAQGELIFLLIMGSIMAVPVITTFMMSFGNAGVSSTALPVITLVWIFMAGFLHSGAVDHSLPAHAAEAAAVAVASPYTWETFVYGTLSAFGQIFMHGNPVTGALVLAGVLANSRITGVMGVIGCLVSIAISMWVGIPEAKVADGAYAFNSALTMMALGGFFIYLDWRAFLYALIGGVLAMWVYIAAESILAGSHLPAMVAGFAIVNAFMTYAAKFLGTVRLVDMENLSIPEKSLLKNAPPLPADAS
ncbi:MAG: urea transporter [Acidimicrobiia bacterium]